MRTKISLLRTAMAIAVASALTSVNAAEREYEGAVTGVDAQSNQLTVELDSGNTRTFTVTDETEIEFEHAPLTLQEGALNDIVEGDAVVLVVDDSSGEEQLMRFERNRDESGGDRGAELSARAEGAAGSENRGESTSAQRSAARRSDSARGELAAAPQGAEARAVTSPTTDASGSGGSRTARTLEQLVAQHEEISTFVRALRVTGLADAVLDGRYTAFAPTNAAFASLEPVGGSLFTPQNRDRLIAIVRNHLIDDRVDASAAGALDQALTLTGETVALKASGRELRVNDARVVAPGLEVGPLLVHVIDGVLEPTSTADSALQAAREQRAAAEGGAVADARSSRDADAGTEPLPEFDVADADSNGAIDRGEYRDLRRRLE